MGATLRHRGPDAEAVWIEDAVGFAHRRLSIIATANSPQPMTSADGRFVLCFNGEIFNYRELRATLDYPFRTDGDTEVLLALFAADGVAGLHRLQGQFAFAVQDRFTGTTWLVRDRLGVLPLYYSCVSGRFAFASEVKALLPAMPQRPSVDHASLDSYLAGRAVPAPDTLFEGVHKLPPGCVLRLGPDGVPQIFPYWQIPDAGDRLAVTPAEAVDLVADALDEAVRAAMVADEPVGAYLSGGIDSSLIVAAMRAASDGPISTFSASFGEGRHDELPYARTVATLLGTDHHEVHVSAQDFSDSWSTLTWHRDAPVSEPADAAVAGLARTARQHVKVVLSGEGSDELFAGYPKHRAVRLEELGAKLLPAAARRRAADFLVPRLPGSLHKVRAPLGAWGGGSPAERLQNWFAPFTSAERARLLGPDAVLRPGPGTAPQRAGLRSMLEYDLQRWLPDNLLERGDRMSMAASLELRPPFLDHRLVELAFRLPEDVKVRDGVGKWVVRQAARRRLPDEIVNRPKAGFRVPLNSWFRGDLADFARERLLDPASFAREAFAPQEVAGLLDRHRDGVADEGIRIWTLLSLEIWHDVFFRGELTPTGPLAAAGPGSQR
jgi:asparagine synthase (glutamine-hydrolysing)